MLDYDGFLKVSKTRQIINNSIITQLLLIRLVKYEKILK